MGFGMFQKSIEPFEDLPNFYHVVPQKFIERLIKQNRHLLNSYGFATMQHNFLTSFEEVYNYRKGIEPKNGKWSKLVENLKDSPLEIMNVPWYNVLYQPDYVEMFGYIGPHVKYRNLLIKDEDNNIFNNHF